MFRRNNIQFTLFMLASDLALTLVALACAIYLRAVLPFRQESAELASLDRASALALVSLILLIWTMVFSFGSVYDTRRTLRVSDELQGIVMAVLVAAFLLAGALYLSVREVSRVLFVYFCIVDLSLLVISRLTVRSWFGAHKWRWPGAERRTLIIGAGVVGRQIEKKLIANQRAGIVVIGYLDDDPAKQGKCCERAPVIGATCDLERIVCEQQIEAVVFALPLRSHQRLIELVAEVKHLPVRMYVVPDIFSLAFYLKVDELDGIPMLGLREPAIDGYQRLVKRLFDLVVAALLLLLLSPILLAIAVAVRLDSPGCVIFRQQRVGENGRVFGMYKFRSMVQGAEFRQAKMMQCTADGKYVHKYPGDPRVTRIGRFIRATSLDELPQLFNVLQGNMSLVGPRPEMPALVEHYEFWQRQRFAVPQGMTGWWQVNGRSDKPMHLHTMEDLYYIQNYSLWLDIHILWKTIGAVLKRKGAF